MPKIRVLVVDDAVVIRKLITETLRKDPDLEVVGAAANGRIALQKIPQVNPDIITLDVEMPEMDGLATLREVRKLYPQIGRHHVQHHHPKGGRGHSGGALAGCQ